MRVEVFGADGPDAAEESSRLLRPVSVLKRTLRCLFHD